MGAIIDNVSLESSGIKYSLEEVNTGNKWIDGKDIYFKSFHGSKITKVLMGIGVNVLDQLLELHVSVKSGADGGWRTLPWTFSETGTFYHTWTGGVYYSPKTDQIILQCGSDLASFTDINIIMAYTKK